MPFPSGLRNASHGFPGAPHRRQLADTRFRPSQPAIPTSGASRVLGTVLGKQWDWDMRKHQCWLDNGNETEKAYGIIGLSKGISVTNQNDTDHWTNLETGHILLRKPHSSDQSPRLTTTFSVFLPARILECEVLGRSTTQDYVYIWVYVTSCILKPKVNCMGNPGFGLPISS